MIRYRALLCAAFIIPAACSFGDPLVGEFTGQLVGHTHAKNDEVGRFRVSKQGQQYHLSIWNERSSGWRDLPAALDSCSPELLSGFLGENRQELAPEGACSKDVMLFHARKGDSIPSLKTSAYALVVGGPFGGGGVFDLHKVN
ncbi:MAG: hypothetical protein ACJ8R9_21290 [Steroidobacteraceae bacterium]